MLGVFARSLPALGQARWRRRQRWLLGTVVFVLAVGIGCGFYARQQWRTFRDAVRTEQFELAEAKQSFCLSIWPRDEEALWLAARLARKQSRFQDAEQHLNRCMKLHGGASETTQLEFLLIRAQTGEVDEVAPQLFRYIEGGHADAPEIYKTIARGFIHQLQYGPALNCLKQWLEEHPNTAIAYHWRGWVLERLDSAEGARADYEKALTLDPTLFTVRLRLAEMFLEDKQIANAIPHLEWLYERHPDRPLVWARLGQGRFLSGREAEAKELMTKAAEQLPNDPVLMLNLGKVNLQSDPVAAERWLRRCLAIDPSDTEAQYTLVNALQRQRRRDEAEKMFADYQVAKARLDRANKLLQEEARNPSQGPERLAEIGKHLLEVGQERQGVIWLNKALAFDPNHALANRLLADHYAKKGDAESAAQHRRRVLQAPVAP